MLIFVVVDIFESFGKSTNGMLQWKWKIAEKYQEDLGSTTPLSNTIAYLRLIHTLSAAK